MTTAAAPQWGPEVLALETRANELSARAAAVAVERAEVGRALAFARQPYAPVKPGDVVIVDFLGGASARYRVLRVHYAFDNRWNVVGHAERADGSFGGRARAIYTDWRRA